MMGGRYQERTLLSAVSCFARISLIWCLVQMLLAKRPRKPAARSSQTREARDMASHHAFMQLLWYRESACRRREECRTGVQLQAASMTGSMAWCDFGDAGLPVHLDRFGLKMFLPHNKWRRKGYRRPEELTMAAQLHCRIVILAIWMDGLRCFRAPAQTMEIN